MSNRKNESSMREKPTEAFFVRSHADLSCMPESVACYEDFESAIGTVRDEVEQQDPDYLFYEAEDTLKDLTEEQLKMWGIVVLASVVGEHALGGIVITYINDGTIIDEWWDEETGDFHDH